MGAENPVTSCDLQVFVDEAAEPVSSQRPDCRAGVWGCLIRSDVLAWPASLGMVPMGIPRAQSLGGAGVAESRPQTIAYPAPSSRPHRRDLEPLAPHVIVLFGATGDLAKRKLLPGLAYLEESALAPDVRVVGTAMEDLSTDEFRALARSAVESFGTHAMDDDAWARFAERLTYVPQGAGPEEPDGGGQGGRDLARSADSSAALLVGAAQGRRGRDHDAAGRRPGRKRPGGDGEAVRQRPRHCDQAQRLRARGVRRVADLPDRPLPGQGGGAEHPGVPVRQRPVRAHLEPQLHRPRADRHSRDARARPACELLRIHRCVQGHGGDAPDAGAGVRRDGASDSAGTASDQRGEEQGLPLDAADPPERCGARSVRRLPRRGGRRRRLRHRDVHRAEGRRRQLAVGRRAVLPAHRQADGRGHADHLDRFQGGAAERCSRPVPGWARRDRTT